MIFKLYMIHRKFEEKMGWKKKNENKNYLYILFQIHFTYFNFLYKNYNLKNIKFSHILFYIFHNKSKY